MKGVIKGPCLPTLSLIYIGKITGVINKNINPLWTPFHRINMEALISILRFNTRFSLITVHPIVYPVSAVRRILGLKFKLGLFSDPFAKREFAQSIGSKHHRALARQAVRESLDLMKNDNHALPLKRKDNIVVVGEHALNTGLQSGGWSIHWQGQTESYAGATSIYQGVAELAKEYDAVIEPAAVSCNAQSSATKSLVSNPMPRAQATATSSG